jgi:hypothetical protein
VQGAKEEASAERREEEKAQRFHNHKEELRSS